MHGELAHLYKSVHTAADEVLPIWRESGNLWVYLPSKLDGAVELHGTGIFSAGC